MAAIFLASAFAVVITDESSEAVAAGDLDNYYYNQLSADEKSIFDTMMDPTTGIKTDSILSETVGTVTTYYVPVATAVNFGDAEQALSAACRVYEAVKLQDPFAWFTWGNDAAIQSVTVTASAPAEFKIKISGEYCKGNSLPEVKTGLQTMVDQSKAKLTELIASFDLGSKSDAEKLDKLNDYICGKSIEYDAEAEYSSSIYGALVAADDKGVHRILCEGYSSLVQAFCIQEHIPCISVFGMSAQSENDYHAWNVVVIGSGTVYSAYGIDATWNDTGSDKRAFLLAGALSEDAGITFTMSHQAFRFDSDWYGSDYSAYKTVAPYTFMGYALSDEGYEWPADNSIVTTIVEYAPWIVVAVICALLAFVLFNMGKRGD
ncbi:hypothetical protein TALC_00602 [Thermoplasmatales archaeon BRNA1]|nr:hypothetical protein TALC_00602 [Thermoplasmatales archaeon BRNA1]